MAYYVAVDIGCIECGETSAVLGIFESEVDANEACDEHSKRQEEHWGGQHYFEVFGVPRISKVIRQEYGGMFNRANEE